MYSANVLCKFVSVADILPKLTVFLEPLEVGISSTSIRIRNPIRYLRLPIHKLLSFAPHIAQLCRMEQRETQVPRYIGLCIV